MTRLLTTALLLLALALSSLPAAERPPNIIFLFADDLGWGDLACYGHPYSKTPHLDRLATEGTRFLQCYATGVTCCPSRTGFMTSKFPATFAKYPANGGFSGRVTITELLKKQGYATGHFGKWHIGPDEKPGTYGIDFINSNREGEAPAEPGRIALRSRDAHLYDSAITFIEQHKAEPFYVNVWGHISHHPVNPSPALLAAFGPLQVDESKFPPTMQEKFAACKARGGDVSRHLRAYLAEVQALDAEVGRLLQRLDALGLRENTIVVFSSDQGPAPLRDSVAETPAKQAKRQAKKKKGGGANDSADIRLNTMGYAGPFKGSKHNQYEGGVRIPFIIRWPSHTPAGRVDENSVLSGADWLPTLCHLAGIKINAADFDGQDASPAWLGQDFTRTNPLLWKTSSPQSPAAIRLGPWKLHYPNSRRTQLELYNILTDPTEQQNLASQNPDIVKQLSTTIETWQATLPKEYDKTTDDEK